MRRRPAGPVAIALAVVGTLVGCGGVSPDLPPGLSVVVYQPRPDIVLGQFALQVVNDGAATVEIIGARLDSPDFVDAVVWTGSSTVLAGRALDLRVPLPQIECSAESAPRVRLTADVGSPSESSEVEVADPYDLLPRLHREACLSEEIAAIAALTPREVILPAGAEPAILVLGVDPTGAPGVVTLHEVAGTTLLQPALDGRGVDRLDLEVDLAAEGPSEVRIPFVPNRCDAHALAEDKVGTVIPFTVSTPRTEVTRWLLPATEEVRARWYAYVAAYCGLPVA